MEYTASVIRQEKKTAIIHRHDCLHRKPYEFYKNTGSKVAEIKVHKQNAIIFLHANNTHSKMKF